MMTGTGRQAFSSHQRLVLAGALDGLRGVPESERAEHATALRASLEDTLITYLAFAHQLVAALLTTVRALKSVADTLREFGTPEALGHARALSEISDKAAIRPDSPQETILLNLPDGLSADQLGVWIENLLRATTTADDLFQALDLAVERLSVAHSAVPQVADALGHSSEPRLQDIAQILSRALE